MKRFFSFILVAAAVLAGCKKNDGPKQEAAYEEFAIAIEEMEKQWTMVYNVTAGNEENAVIYAGNEDYEKLVAEVNVMLSGVAQSIETKKTWAEESFQAGKLASDLDEILSTFENDIQIPLTQILNYYNDAVEELTPSSPLAEELFLALEQYEQQLTMVYNVTVNNQENAEKFAGNPAYETLCESVTVMLSSVQQTINVKKTWIEESFAAGTLEQDAEEIYSSFENDIQIPLTQALNLYNDTVEKLSETDSLFEELMLAIESLEQQWTMVYNVTVGNEENEKYAGLPGFDDMLAGLNTMLSGIQQTINVKKAWVEESAAAGTLEQDAEEIYSTFESDIQIPLNQVMNLYNDSVESYNLYFEIYSEIEGLEQQWTMVYNTTVNNPDYDKYAGYPGYDKLISETTSLLNGIQRTILTKKSWAEESLAAGKLAEEAEELMASLENDVQIPLTQAMNFFNDQVLNFPAYEEMYMMIQDLYAQWSMVYNATVNNTEHKEAYGDLPAYQELVSNVTILLNGISQSIATKWTWVEELCEKLTLVEGAEEIMASFETDVQIPLTQAKNLYDDTLAEIIAE